MARGIYLGVSDKAKAVKALFVGVDGTAKRVRKAYIGVGGVARQCFPRGRFFFYGEIGSLGITRSDTGSGSTNAYAVFAGGNREFKSYVPSSYVDAYDSSLTRKSISSLQVASINPDVAANGINGYMIIGGGVDSDNTSQKYTTGYNESLTKISTAYLNAYKSSSAATGSTNFLCFIGGYGSENYGGSPRSNLDCDAYYVGDGSFVKMTDMLDYSIGGELCAAEGTKNSIFVAGGLSGNSSVWRDRVTKIDESGTSLTVNTLTSLSEARYGILAAKTNDYIIFAGGAAKDNSATSAIDMYKISSGTKYTSVSISLTRKAVVMSSDSVSAKNKAVFRLGEGELNVFDNSLTRSIEAGDGLYSGASIATVGNYVLSAGSDDGFKTTSVIAYALS